MEKGSQAMRRYDILLMDADETLFDFQRAEALALDQTLTECGLASSPETTALYSKINDQLWKEFEQGKVTKSFLQKARFVRLFEQAGFQGDGEAASCIYPSKLAEASFLLPGAEELCRELVEIGCILYLTTNGISRVQRRRLEKSSIKRYISEVFVSEDTGAQKPQIEYYQYIFATIPGLDRSRILAVGDSLTSDIQGGINAGLDTCWYNPKGKVSGSVYPTYEIRRLEELPGVIDPDIERGVR